MNRFRAWLRWVPPAVLTIVLLPAWVLFLSGGMRAVYGFVTLITAGQVLAPLALLTLIVHAIRKHRFSRPMQATLALALLALWPALWGFGVLTLTFPYDLDESKPSVTVRLPSNETLRVAWRGDQVATNYHAFTPDQRLGIRSGR